jgi:hypothetical protein
VERSQLTEIVQVRLELAVSSCAGMCLPALVLSWHVGAPTDAHPLVHVCACDLTWVGHILTHVPASISPCAGCVVLECNAWRSLEGDTESQLCLVAAMQQQSVVRSYSMSIVVVAVDTGCRLRLCPAA